MPHGRIICQSGEEVAIRKQRSMHPPVVPQISPTHAFENEYFQVSCSTIAGLGAFAKQDLHFGDVILREKPLFLAEPQRLFDEFGKLAPSLKRVALSLHSNPNLKAGTPRIQAIWNTNWQVTIEVPSHRECPVWLKSKYLSSDLFAVSRPWEERRGFSQFRLASTIRAIPRKRLNSTSKRI